MRIIIDDMVKKLRDINNRDLPIETLIYALGQVEMKIYDEREKLIKELFQHLKNGRRNGSQ